MRVPAFSAAGAGCGLDAGIDAERPGMRLAGMARDDGQLRYRADRRQRLAAEAERRDRHQVVVVGELGRGVALDRERRDRARVMPTPSSVMRIKPPAAAIGDDLDLLRAGIERVLDQFLHHAGRPLHHLAGGNAVDDGFGELADRHGGILQDSGPKEGRDAKLRRPCSLAGAGAPVPFSSSPREWSAGRRQGACEASSGGPVTQARRALTACSGYPERPLSERAGPIT